MFIEVGEWIKMVTCSNCCYYELIVINIFPFEYCHKHNWTNRNPCDFKTCSEYKESRWIRLYYQLFGRVKRCVKENGYY